MNLLIPYVDMSEPDPLLEEYTYGDGGFRARKLLNDVHKGDYLFFHTTINGKKVITAYYIVDRVIDTIEVCRNHALLAKYRNPHIAECIRNGYKFDDDNAIVFGDPITSKILKKPLPFNRILAEYLSLGIKFNPGKTETQIIGSATRAWREITKKDVTRILREIEKYESQLVKFERRTTEEVAETLERDIESYIAHNPKIIDKNLRLFSRQQILGEGRSDLILENKNGSWTIIEIKLGHIGREAIKQINNYVNVLKIETKRNINAVIICAGVMPAFIEELQKQKDVRIITYGWELSLNNWHE